jgi:hypothetical protein
MPFPVPVGQFDSVFVNPEVGEFLGWQKLDQLQVVKMLRKNNGAHRVILNDVDIGYIKKTADGWISNIWMGAKTPVIGGPGFNAKATSYDAAAYAARQCIKQTLFG